jgi:hypothetical protein
MAIRELAKEALWVSYILFLVTIVLIPVARNVYCIIKYKMSFSKYNKKIIDSFLEKNTCIYAAKYYGYKNVLLVSMLIVLVIVTPYLISSGDERNLYYFLLSVVVFIFLHIAWIFNYVSCLYDACYMTNTSMLIRGVETTGSFKTIQLHDIEIYIKTDPSIMDKLFLNPKQDITIITKYNKVFNITDLDNREELIDALKSYTNSIEETLG